jgi:DnaK suppressor protein
VRSGDERHGAGVMNKSDLVRYKNLLLTKQQELTTGKSLADSIPASDEPRGDPIDMAASEATATVQMRLKQTDSKLLRAIEDALTRIRQERFGTCEECGQPISKARLEAVPWGRLCKDCKEQQGSRS